MKKIFLLYMLLIAAIPVLLAQPAEFDFTPNNASGGIIATVQVDGTPASPSDFIAAFDENDNCAGAVQLLDYGGQAFCNLQVYGNDTTTPDIDEGIDGGETFTFKLWVASSGEILDHPMDIAPVADWNAGLNGSPVPGYGFADNVVLNFMRAAAPDADGDGYSGADDPDDTDPCNPDNNVTVCDSDGDGIPDGSDTYPNCAGTPDECDVCNGPGIATGTCDCVGTLPTTWYADNDGDGLGDPNNSIDDCSQPAGYVANADDSNDTCDGVLDECGVCGGSGIAAGTCDCAGTLPTTWYPDADGDGLGDPNGYSVEDCNQPDGFVANSNDDNDTCDGVLDECGVCDGGGIAAGTCDCAGTLPATWYADADGDGLGDPNNSVEDCNQPAGYVANSNDDNDTCSGAIDECGVCDGPGIAAGTCDCAGTPAATWYADNDNDGLGDPANSTQSCSQPAGYVANGDDDNDSCDGVFDECGVCDGPGIPAGACDCSGASPATWYADTDNDGLGDFNNSTESCEQPAGYVANATDLDDTTPNQPADVPTLSQWGLILLCLILLSMATVSIIQNKNSLAHNRGATSSSSFIPNFDAALFQRMLLKSIPIMLLIFVLISFIEDGWFIRNLVGTILSTGVVVYLLHFIMLSESFKNGQEE